jgi:putative ABC transport system permease protein
MARLVQDIRYGVRMLVKAPGFTAIAILTLALGIGANSAIFSVVNATILTRPSYSEPDKLFMVWEWNRRLAPNRSAVEPGNISHDRNTISPGNFLHWRAENTVFDDLAAWYDFDTNLTGQGEPERIPAQAVTPNLMSMLGVNARFGRVFLPEEGQAGKDNVVILGYGLWQRRFASDPAVVGKTILLDRQVLTIVGIMPPTFQFSVMHGSLTGEPPELWEPLTFDKESWTPHGRYMSSIARLKKGVSLAQAQSQMDAIAAGLEKQFPAMDTNWGVNLVSLHEQSVGGIRPALLILLGAVGFVLLIACANVANLQLARATARHKELAVRSALGAGRRRIVRQLLTESVVVAFLGGAAGVLLANWGIAVLLSFAPRSLPGLQSVHVDLRVLAFTAFLVLLTGMLFGLAPAVAATRRDLNEALKDEGRGAGQSARGGRLRRILVVAETSLAVVLLIGAGLLIRSFEQLQAVSPGFDPRNLLSVKIDLPGAKYSKPAQNVAFFRQLLDRVRTLPGVESASGNAFLPFTGLGAATDFYVVGRPVPPASGERPVVDVRVIEPDYFRTMRIPLLRGRFFNEREGTEESHVVIINDTMAREQWPDQDPIGQQVVIEMKDKNVPSTIVGVVGDVKHAGLDAPSRAMSYWPHPELPYNFMSLAIRTTGDPMRASVAVEQQVRALDSDEPISQVRTMDQWMADSTSQARFNTVLLATFAGVALMLAVVGIYGVMAYSVTQRTREFGIRIALGARISDVLRLVTREGFSLALVGVALGLLLSLAMTQLLRSLLFQVSALDPWVFASVAAILSVVALTACLIPARRATRVDPMVALRYE